MSIPPVVDKKMLDERARAIADDQAYSLLKKAIEGASDEQADFHLMVLKHTALNLLGQLVFNHALDKNSGLYSNSLALTRCNELSSEIYEIVKMAKKLHQEGELEKVEASDVKH
jgi:hypothetical protein